jgi:hypothetical protein
VQARGECEHVSFGLPSPNLRIGTHSESSPEDALVAVVDGTVVDGPVLARPQLEPVRAVA